jgi:diaminopimelate decarboxylase
MTVNSNNRMPLMAKKYLDSFIGTYVEKKDFYLEAVRQHGSPLYLLEKDVLAQRARQFKSTFNANLPKVRCYFAMKSNNLPLIIKLLVQEGFGIDVSSGIELSIALLNGADDIIFSGPGKTDEELSLAIKHSSKTTILVDSFGEIGRIKKLLKNERSHLCVGVRLNNNPSGLWRKFGIPLDQLHTVYSEIKKIPNLQFKGLQFHSSWNLEPDRQIEFIKLLGSHLKTMPGDFLDSIEFIDIGGGYWPEQGEWLVGDHPLEHYHLPAYNIDAFANGLSKVLKENILNQIDCTICLEPGRWICNNAMHILMRIIDKKEENLVIADAGTNIIGWERFETDYCPVINLTDFEAIEHPCHVLGSLCTPHDVWGYAYYGKSISVGDVLMVPTQGAYTYSLRQHFIKSLPKVVVIGKTD